MRRYETIVIIDSDLSEEGRKPILERLDDLIPQYDGFLIKFDEWGVKKLAYEIKKKVRGFYLRMDYCGDGQLVDEIERFFRIDDRILKFMTILQEEDTDLEAIKAELEKEKQAKEAEAAATAEAEKAAAEPAEEAPAPPAEDAPADSTESSVTEGDQPETQSEADEEA